jgi:hypothetical protein
MARMMSAPAARPGRRRSEKRVLIDRLRAVSPGVAEHIRERLPETQLPRERQVDDDADLGDFVLAVVAADRSPLVINFLSIVISMRWTTATFTVSDLQEARIMFSRIIEEWVAERAGIAAAAG